MIKIENVVTPSDQQWEAVVRGVRNPFNSWEKSDSGYGYYGVKDNYIYNVGKKDLELMTRLANAGDDHGKFMRMLPVIMDITAPHYWWPEMDHYKVGTVTDSCSKMHTLLAKPFELDDFSWNIYNRDYYEDVIHTLNMLRDQYLNGDLDERMKMMTWRSILELLPMGYMQKRTWSGNYMVLKHIYHARKDHKLKEWHDFCNNMKALPYAWELIIGKE